MKPCPYCAEEIQDAAIKCRFCGEFLSTAPADAAAPASKAGDEAPAGERRPDRPERGREVDRAGRREDGDERRREVDRDGRRREGDRDDWPAPFRGGAADHRERRVLYAGAPSWRAYFKIYALIVLGAIGLPLIVYAVSDRAGAGIFGKFLGITIPLAVAAVAFAGVHLYRRSQVVRVSTTNIETEAGILSKKIDVLELWRCRDVRYRQSLFDRILGIAHIEVYTADVTTPQLQIVGMPASRQLFEQIRDSIEIQRQTRNVYGVIQ